MGIFNFKGYLDKRRKEKEDSEKIIDTRFFDDGRLMTDVDKAFIREGEIRKEMSTWIQSYPSGVSDNVKYKKDFINQLKKVIDKVCFLSIDKDKKDVLFDKMIKYYDILGTYYDKKLK